MAMMKEFTSQKEAQEHVSQASKSAENMVHCGHLACQHDSSLKTLEGAQIISCATYPFETAKKGKKKKKKQQKGDNSDSNSGSDSQQNYSPDVYAITLTDSVFFPEGGGQPADRGILRMQHPSTDDHNPVELHVSDAQNINEMCVLFCRALSSTQPDQIAEFLNQSNNDGDLKITQHIDWDRRFDLMTQHRAQHLVSAVALGEYKIPTHTFSLSEKKTSYIDLIIDESWDKNRAIEIFTEIEQKANEHIRNNLPMTPTWLDVDDPLFETKVRSRLLPDGIKGPIRLVEIASGDIDMNTCCGTHVKNLGQLQMIKFFRMEKVKRL